MTRQLNCLYLLNVTSVQIPLSLNLSTADLALGISPSESPVIVDEAVLTHEIESKLLSGGEVHLVLSFVHLSVWKLK